MLEVQEVINRHVVSLIEWSCNKVVNEVETCMWRIRPGTHKVEFDFDFVDFDNVALLSKMSPSSSTSTGSQIAT